MTDGLARDLGRELGDLLCSRLCHDLAGALSGIGTGVELLEEIGGPPDPDTLSLLKQSAATAVGRLQFFRLAFGAAGNAVPDIGFGEALAYARATAPQRAVLEWHAGAAAARPGPGAVKLMLNTALLAAEAMPRGGVVRVSVDGGALLAVEAVAVAGGSVNLADGALAALETEPAPGSMTVKTALAGYLGRLARAANAGLTIERAEGKISFRLRLPTP
jgi:histidine phosphotransferase ChpT